MEHKINWTLEEIVKPEDMNRIEQNARDVDQNLNDHAASKSNPHGVTKPQIGLGNVDNTSDESKPLSKAARDALVKKVDKENGKELSANDFTNAYKTKLDNAAALGETAETAYRGDRGKTAYDHSLKISGNPHKVTKTDVGLSNADNTSDVNKPVSTAMQTALNQKVTKETGKGLSTNDFTNAYKSKLDNAPTDVNSVLSKKGNVFAKRKKNITVTVSSWVADNTFADYPYKTDIIIEGITEAEWKVSDMYTADEAREILAPDVLAGNGFVRIWSEAIPDHNIVFDSIDVTKVVE